MALDNFRRIVIDVDTANDYIPPVMLSGGDSNGRTLLVKLTDNGKAITSAAGITAKLAYVDGCGNSGYKTMTSVGSYETVAWECAAPGSVLKTDSAHLCVQFWQGSDVVCTRVFHASVDRNLVSLESGTTSGDAVKELYDTIANLNKTIEDANGTLDTAVSSANTKINEAVERADTSTKKANDAASTANENAGKASSAAEAATEAKRKANDAAASANSATETANASAKKADTAAQGANDAKTEALKAAEEARGSVSDDRKFYFKRVTDANGDTRPVIVDMTIG